MGIVIHKHREIVFALSAALVAIALGFIVQFQGYPPCELCLYQRYIYFAIIGVSAAALLMKRHLLIFFILFFLMAAEVGVAFFHTGVENHVFKYESSCVTNIQNMIETDDITKLLNEEHVVPCDQPLFLVHGISMAAWNTAYAAMILSIFTYLSYAKKKKVIG